MRAHSPRLFQHPWPVGCSLAVLHLCSKDPGVSEKDGDGAVVLYVSQTGRKRGRAGREKWDRTDWLGVVETGIRPKCCICQMRCKHLYLTCRRVSPLLIFYNTHAQLNQWQEVFRTNPRTTPLPSCQCCVFAESSFVSQASSHSFFLTLSPSLLSAGKTCLA